MSVNTVRSSVYKPFWHSGLLKIVLAGFLVCTSFYMFLPVYPGFVRGTDASGNAVFAYAGILFGIGLFLPAPFCNYWMDVYRRKGVAQRALACFAGVLALMQIGVPVWAESLLWLSAGSALSVFQIALGNTLLLDLSHTKQRTEVAHIYYWSGRLALVFGILMARLIPVREGNFMFLCLSVSFLVVAWLLVSSLSVPFRAPLNPSRFSLDRFWLPRGFRIFILVFLVASFAGLSLGCIRERESCLFLGVGFLFALTIHQYFFKDNMQAEIISGFLLLLASCAVRARLSGCRADYAAVACLGAGVGFTASRFLLAFIRICEHCERGTAQTSCWLGWETGLVAGFMTSFFLGENSSDVVSGLSCVLVSSAFLIYLFAVRKWYVVHRRK